MRKNGEDGNEVRTGAWEMMGDHTTTPPSSPKKNRIRNIIGGGHNLDIERN